MGATDVGPRRVLCGLVLEGVRPQSRDELKGE